MKALISALLSLLFATASTLTAAEAKHALLIGVWDYTSPEFPRLEGVESEMANLAAKLQRMGFEVVVLSNPSREEATMRMDKFGEALEKAKGIGVFYYYGHAVEVGGRNFLIPGDISVRYRSDLELEAMSLDRLVMHMEEANNAGNLVLLDVANEGDGMKTFNRKLIPIEGLGVLVGLSETKPGDSTGASFKSAFTDALVQYIDMPGITANRMLREVNESVKEASGDQQRIVLFSRQSSDFQLSPGLMAASPGPPALPQPNAQWQMEDKDPQNELDQQIQKLKAGTIAFNTPDTMTLEEAQLIHLVLSPTPADVSIQKQVTGGGTVVTAEARYSRVVEARLEGEAFKISTASAARQPMSEAEPTEWRWQIVPKVPGTHQLFLSLYAVVLVDGERHERLLKTFERKLSVTVSFSRSPVAFMRHNPAWGMAGAGLAILGLTALSICTRFNRRITATSGSWRSITQPLKIDLFVSYSSKDRSWVIDFVAALRSRSLLVWMDQGGIVPAAFWAEQISQAISEAKVVVLVGSSHSFASHNVAKEISLASAMQKTILPIIVDGSKVPSLLAYQLAGIQITNVDPRNLQLAVDAVMSLPALTGVDTSNMKLQ